MKKIIIPGTIPTPELHQYLLGSVSPRPIAFVSTVDEKGNSNLAPYSFFNAFSSNPPVLVFSSNRRVQDNTTKDTLHNILATKECVINVVPYTIVRQMMICSVDYPHEMNEFEQAGLHEEKALQVKASLVKESPVNMECKVREIISLGDEGGAGHLIICDVVCLHIDEKILDLEGKIDPNKIDLMGRMGKAFYVRASGEAVLAMPQSQHLPIIGYPNLPEEIRTSMVLTANDIGILSGLKSLPSEEELNDFKIKNQDLMKVFHEDKVKAHQYARDLLNKGQFKDALNLLVSIS